MNYSSIIRTAADCFNKSEIHDIIRIYKDDWTDIIASELKNLFSPETYQKLFFLITRENNILKRVVNDISTLYNKPPQRRAMVGDEPDEVFDGLDSTLKNLALKSINRYTNLLNHSLLMVSFRRGALDYDVINFDNASVFFDCDDWREMIAVKFYIGLNYDGLLTPHQTLYRKAYIWAKKPISNVNCEIINNDSYRSIEGGKIYELETSGRSESIISVIDIPYLDAEGQPILPFILFDREFPVGERLDFTTGNDLRDLNINSAIILAMINQLYLHQTFKQVVINTPNLDKLPNPLRFGPGNILTLEHGRDGATPSATTLDLMTDIEKLQKTLQMRVMDVLSGYGVSPQNFSMSATPQSGYALTISNMGKMEVRQGQIPLYRNREKELFEIERTIYNYHAPSYRLPLIDVKAEFEVDFAEITFPQTPTEQQQHYKMLKDYNVISDIDIIMEQNSDITRERAEQIYRENKALNSKALGVNDEIEQALFGAPPGSPV
jgi:hypothetical protein